MTTQACDKKKNERRFRLACFTVFEMDFDFSKLNEKLQFYAYGKETCPETKREHYQCFGYSAQAQRWSWWHKLLAPHHFQECNGTLAQNEKYCAKAGQYTEYGVKPMGDGKKRSLECLAEAVVEAGRTGVPLDEVVLQPESQATFCQYNNGLSKLYNMAVTQKCRKVDKDFAPEVIYIWGPPGSGKTRMVRELDPEVFMIPLADKYKWKDGYCGQDAVVYENVSPERIEPDHFLVEIDRYYCQVSVKSSFIGWRPRRIYITSVYSPESFAEQAKFSLPSEFTRRVTKVLSVGVYKPPEQEGHDGPGQA